MRVTKPLVFLTTVLVVFLGLSLVASSVNAGPLIGIGTGPLQEARNEVKILLGKTTGISQVQAQLRKLNDLMENTVDGLIDQVRTALNLIDTCDVGTVTDPSCVHDIAILIEKTMIDKAFILVVKFETFLDFLHEFEVGLGELTGKIGGLKEIGKLRVDIAINIEILLAECDKIVTNTDIMVAEAQAKLEDGDAGEDPNDENTWDDVDDFLAGALQKIQEGDFENAARFLDLGALPILQQIQQVNFASMQVQLSTCKTDLKRVQRLLGTGLGPVRSINSELAEKSFRVEGASTVRAQVYTLSGRQVGETQVADNALSLNTTALANGSYLVVVTGLSREGHVISSSVQKLVVLH